MKPKINPFIGTVRAVATAMSKKAGLNIRFAGTKAKTDGTTIWLPANLPFEDEKIVAKVTRRRVFRVSRGGRQSKSRR